MNIVISISAILLTALFFIFSMLKQQQARRKAVFENEPPPLKKISIATSILFANPTDKRNTINNIGGQEHVWWSALDNTDQLELALMLTQKGLIAWEKYAGVQDIIYSNSATAAASKIDNQLLQKTIEEIILQSQLLLPGSDNKKINQYYNYFVGPVIALQDGKWLPPYPVKKIFLSVYHILKSILEQNSPASFETFLAISINQSIDCMDMAKLYSREDIAAFLKVYKDKL